MMHNLAKHDLSQQHTVVKVFSRNDRSMGSYRHDDSVYDTSSTGMLDRRLPILEISCDVIFMLQSRGLIIKKRCWVGRTVSKFICQFRNHGLVKNVQLLPDIRASVCQVKAVLISQFGVACRITGNGVRVDPLPPHARVVASR
jgi:hypothetical protein